MALLPYTDRTRSNMRREMSCSTKASTQHLADAAGLRLTEVRHAAWADRYRLGGAKPAVGAHGNLDLNDQGRPRSGTVTTTALAFVPQAFLALWLLTFGPVITRARATGWAATVHEVLLIAGLAVLGALVDAMCFGDDPLTAIACPSALAISNHPAFLQFQ